MARVRDMRGGKDYDADFSRRMKGEGMWADLLKQRFRMAVKRCGLNERARGILDFSQFCAPQRSTPMRSPPQPREAAQTKDHPQLSLF